MLAGNAKSMLVTNCLFRLGGVAALLSNRPGDARAAKYRLDHVVRTHLGADPTAYKCAPCAGLSAEMPAVCAAGCAWTLSREKLTTAGCSLGSLVCHRDALLGALC